MDVDESDQTRDDQPIVPSTVLRCLYTAYFLSRWNARMWEFSVGLFMISLWPDSLLLAALYGAVESASTAFFGPLLGQWIEGSSYIQVLRVWLASQNVSFIVAGSSVFSLLLFTQIKSVNFVAFVCLVAITNAAGAVSALSSLAGTILIEREWIVVICAGHPPYVLTQANSVIRRIDLICKLLAPVLSGFIISFLSTKASAAAIALWSSTAVWFEYMLFVLVYDSIPALAISCQRRVSHAANASPTVLESPSQEDSHIQHAGWRSKIAKLISRIPFIEAWRLYVKHDVWLPGVALALLFFTVLSFGTLMTAALRWEGIPAYVIGIGRGISALVGILSTILYPILHARLSTLRTGLWSIWSQWTCLLLCVASVWVQNAGLAAYLLMAGVATSRLGLWMFDISVLQQMQDQVPESERCVVGGVQNSIQSMMDLLAYLVGIVISDPRDFWKLVLLSFLGVSLAALLYCLFLYLVRHKPRSQLESPLLASSQR